MKQSAPSQAQMISIVAFAFLALAPELASAAALRRAPVVSSPQPVARSLAVANSSTAIKSNNTIGDYYTYYLIQWISSNFCTNTGNGYTCQEMKCTPGYPTCGGGSPFISLTSSGTTCTTVSCSGSGGS